MYFRYYSVRLGCDEVDWNDIDPHEKHVSLVGDGIRSIGDISHLVEIEHLTFESPSITEIDNLHCLTTLRILNLHDCRITVIKNLDTLVKN